VIDDEVTVSGQQDLRLAFHLGPAVAATLAGDTVELQWAGRRGAPVGGRLRLPDRLSWSLWRGSPDPILGWYSPGFGIKEPTTTLIGEGSCCDVARYRTVLEFDD
jgi:hypothetical protein